jgi:hypothetical protein
MKRLAVVALALVSSLAIAQAPTRVRGTIIALEGDVLAVKSRDGKDLKIQLAPDLGVSTAKASTLAELKGKYVGVTAMNQGGRLVAVEVHVLPPQAKPGHTPWDLEPGSTMTNANLEGIAQASGGNEITLNYKDGSQKILVPAGTPVVAFVPGTRADLKPGEWIFTIAGQKGDQLFTQRIAVSKDGIKPPH